MERPPGVPHDVPIAPSRRSRIVAAAAVAVLAVGYAWLDSSVLHPRPHRDFDQVWFAARTLWKGGNPYALIGPGRAFDWPWEFFYPMTAAVIALPIAWLPMMTARLAFVAVNAFVFVYLLSRDGWQRWPWLFGACFTRAIASAQWTPLLVGAALVPRLGFLYAAKPHVGFAVLFSRLRRGAIAPAVIGGTIVFAASAALYPGWWRSWRAAVGSYVPVSLLFTAFGPILLVALLRWRRPEARLLLLMAAVPHTMVPYDSLPLVLVTMSSMESAILAVSSQVIWWMQSEAAASGTFRPTLVNAWYVALLYMPALWMVLRRPNEGELPLFLERFFHRPSAAIETADVLERDSASSDTSVAP